MNKIVGWVPPTRHPWNGPGREAGQRRATRKRVASPLTSPRASVAIPIERAGASRMNGVGM